MRPGVRHPMPIVVAAAMPVMMTDAMPADVPAAVIAIPPGPVTVVVPADVRHPVPIMMTAPVPVVVDTGVTAAMLGARPVGGRRGSRPASKDHRRRQQQGRQESHSHSAKHGASPLTLPTPASSDPMRTDHSYFYRRYNPASLDPTSNHGIFTKEKRAVSASCESVP